MTGSVVLELWRRINAAIHGYERNGISTGLKDDNMS